MVYGHGTVLEDRPDRADASHPHASIMHENVVRMHTLISASWSVAAAARVFGIPLNSLNLPKLHLNGPNLSRLNCPMFGSKSLPWG